MFFHGFGLSPILWSGFPTLTSFIRYPFDPNNELISRWSSASSMETAKLLRQEIPIVPVIPADSLIPPIRFGCREEKVIRHW